MTIHRRSPALLLIVGAAALAVAIPVVVTGGAATEELPWLAGTAIFLAVATVVWRRQPNQPASWWFAVSAGLVAIVQTLDGLLARIGPTADPEPLAWLVLLYQMVSAIAGVGLVHLLGLFPDGRAHRRYERRLTRGLWWLLVLPPIVFVGSPTLLLPSYHLVRDVANPYHLSALAPLGTVAGAGVVAMQGVFIIGAILLVPRYRRATPTARRQIRWLLPPAIFAAAVAVADFVAWRIYPDGAPSVTADFVMSAAWILAIASLPVALALALLRPTVVDVDRVIRRSLVYGCLWALIAATYVAAAAGLGVAAGRRLPLGLAIALTVVATLVFHPARQRLERAADRWVFGESPDPAQLIARLGASLEETVELERLLPRMADTLREGLGLRWARVRLEPLQPSDGEVAAMTVPIVLGDERLGVVECGPRPGGPLTEDDEAVVATLARQAALAVRNVRLTAELERSRARLVRAQDVERRRLERNIHDGVQQDLVALIGQTARVQREFDRDRASGAAAVADLQAGLRHVLGELRDLAHGIHPSVLSDRGLLEAVEALAARSSVPVSVRADASLRGQRFAEAIEGAGYFTVAEALANAGKHAAARQVDVRLARADQTLEITVHDDGMGFDPALALGEGIANLAERLSALGGRLEVESRPGHGTTVTARLRTADG